MPAQMMNGMGAMGGVRMMPMGGMGGPPVGMTHVMVPHYGAPTMDGMGNLMMHPSGAAYAVAAASPQQYIMQQQMQVQQMQMQQMQMGGWQIHEATDPSQYQLDQQQRGQQMVQQHPGAAPPIMGRDGPQPADYAQQYQQYGAMPHEQHAVQPHMGANGGSNSSVSMLERQMSGADIAIHSPLAITPRYHPSLPLSLSPSLPPSLPH